MSSPRLREIAPSLTPEALSEAIHCVATNGRIYRGARAFRFLALRLPLLFPLGLILWLPGVIWIAEIIYRWVSRNRIVFSRLFGCRGACHVLPPRQREGDEILRQR